MSERGHDSPLPRDREPHASVQQGAQSALITVTFVDLLSTCLRRFAPPPGETSLGAIQLWGPSRPAYSQRPADSQSYFSMRTRRAAHFRESKTIAFTTGFDPWTSPILGRKVCITYAA